MIESLNQKMLKLLTDLMLNMYKTSCMEIRFHCNQNGIPAVLIMVCQMPLYPALMCCVANSIDDHAAPKLHDAIQTYIHILSHMIIQY